MKRLFPSISGPSPQVRATSFKHMDALMASIMLLVGLMATSVGELILSTIARIYHIIHGQVLVEPSAAITMLKKAQHWYLGIIRGSNPNGSQEFDHPENFFDPREAGDTRGSTLTALRTYIRAESPRTLLFFDRIVYAFLSIHRLIVLPPVNDFKTITDGTSWTEKTPGSLGVEDITAALSALGISPDAFKKVYREKCKQQWHILMHTAGPNGKASWTAYSDAVALLNNVPLLKQLVSFAELSDLKGLLNDMFMTVNLPGVDGGTGGQVYTAKIHTFEEWGGKTRHVAIIDYWTQLLVTPLHDTLFEFLRRIEMDATFDQDAACDVIRGWTETSSKRELYSCDLTAATDRLPRDFQVQVLSILMGDATLAVNWGKMFSERSYLTVDKTFIKYGAGLPMGSKSNWAMLALCHHVIIQSAAIKANVTPYADYRVCGDDSVITKTSVYDHYTALMTVYGLTINITKSVLHNASLHSAAEFCKRVFVNGSEITSYPVKLVVKTAMNGRLAPQLQNELTRRGSMVPNHILYDYFAGLVDRESLEFLLILNAIPANLSGLKLPVSPPGDVGDLSKWYPGIYNVTVADVTQAYLYVLVTEQLKRLDVLLRQTDLIKKAIDRNAIGYATPNYGIKVKLSDGKEQALMEHIGTKIEGLSSSHPILSAAYAENVRISSLLSAIRTGNVDLSAMALSALLDQFRNALIDAWDDKLAAKGQAERSLIARSMDTLSSIISLPIADSAGKPVIRKLDFTVMLAYVSRLWTVSWHLGSNVMINAVKSRVKSVPALASNALNNVLSTFAVNKRFTIRSHSKSPPR